MLQEGDVVEIPLPDGRVAIGCLLHVSQRFQNAVGFVVFGIKGQLRDDVLLDAQTGNLASIAVLGPMYTHMDAIQHYGWKAYAHQPITESKRLLTKRNVGGNVYVADEFIGPLDTVSESGLNPMLAMGMPLIYSEIAKAFGK